MAGFGDEYIIFEPHSELAGDIYSRFNRQNLAGFEYPFAVRLEERIFVDFQADAVTGAVPVNRQIIFGDYPPGGGVNLNHIGAVFYQTYRGGLGLFDDIENFLIETRRLAETETSGKIAAIAFIFGAKVNQDGIPFFELSFARLMMGTGFVLAEGNYRLEAVFRPELSELEIEHTG